VARQKLKPVAPKRRPSSFIFIRTGKKDPTMLSRSAKNGEGGIKENIQPADPKTEKAVEREQLPLTGVSTMYAPDLKGFGRDRPERGHATKSETKADRSTTQTGRSAENNLLTVKVLAPAKVWAIQDNLLEKGIALIANEIPDDDSVSEDIMLAVVKAISKVIQVESGRVYDTWARKVPVMGRTGLSMILTCFRYAQKHTNSHRYETFNNEFATGCAILRGSCLGYLSNTEGKCTKNATKLSTYPKVGHDLQNYIEYISNLQLRDAEERIAIAEQFCLAILRGEASQKMDGSHLIVSCFKSNGEVFVCLRVEGISKIVIASSDVKDQDIVDAWTEKTTGGKKIAGVLEMVQAMKNIGVSLQSDEVYTVNCEQMTEGFMGFAGHVEPFVAIHNSNDSDRLQQHIETDYTFLNCELTAFLPAQLDKLNTYLKGNRALQAMGWDGKDVMAFLKRFFVLCSCLYTNNKKTLHPVFREMAGFKGTISDVELASANIAICVILDITEGMMLAGISVKAKSIMWSILFEYEKGTFHRDKKNGGENDKSKLTFRFLKAAIDRLPDKLKADVRKKFTDLAGPMLSKALYTDGDPGNFYQRLCVAIESTKEWVRLAGAIAPTDKNEITIAFDHDQTLQVKTEVDSMKRLEKAIALGQLDGVNTVRLTGRGIATAVENGGLATVYTGDACQALFPACFSSVSSGVLKAMLCAKKNWWLVDNSRPVHAGFTMLNSDRMVRIPTNGGVYADFQLAIIALLCKRQKDLERNFIRNVRAFNQDTRLSDLQVSEKSLRVALGVSQALREELLAIPFFPLHILAVILPWREEVATDVTLAPKQKKILSTIKTSEPGVKIIYGLTGSGKTTIANQTSDAVVIDVDLFDRRIRGTAISVIMQLASLVRYEKNLIITTAAMSDNEVEKFTPKGFDDSVFSFTGDDPEPVKHAYEGCC
jgi:hypothetical protein